MSKREKKVWGCDRCSDGTAVISHPVGEPCPFEAPTPGAPVSPQPGALDRLEQMITDTARRGGANMPVAAMYEAIKEIRAAAPQPEPAGAGVDLESDGCPFCGFAPTDSKRIQQVENHRDGFAAVCPNCNASGPTVKSNADLPGVTRHWGDRAMSAWRRRAARSPASPPRGPASDPRGLWDAQGEICQTMCGEAANRGHHSPACKTITGHLTSLEAVPPRDAGLEAVRKIWLEWRENGMANAITKAGEYLHRIGKVVEADYPTDRLRDDAFIRPAAPPRDLEAAARELPASGVGMPHAERLAWGKWWEEKRAPGYTFGIDRESLGVARDASMAGWAARASLSGLPQEHAPSIRGASIPATMRHDAGAYARCSFCGRYSDNTRALGPSFPCDCGKTGGWSGSFKPPTAESKWSGAQEPAAGEGGAG